MRNVGIDIVENARVRRFIASEAFVKKVLSPQEKERFDSFSDERKVQFLSGRFAAKEAIIKCLSYEEVPNMADLDIINDEKGRPVISYKDYDIVVSISHEKNYSTAIAVLREEGL